MTFEKKTIVLADGTTINAILNGNNYITSREVDPDLLDEENLYGMTIDDEEFYDLVCTNCWTESDGTHIIFHSLSPEKQEIAELRAQIDYLMMMGGYSE